MSQSETSNSIAPTRARDTNSQCVRSANIQAGMRGIPLAAEDGGKPQYLKIRLCSIPNRPPPRLMLTRTNPLNTHSETIVIVTTKPPHMIALRSGER